MAPPRAFVLVLVGAAVLTVWLVFAQSRDFATYSVPFSLGDIEGAFESVLDAVAEWPVYDDDEVVAEKEGQLQQDNKIPEDWAAVDVVVPPTQALVFTPPACTQSCHSRSYWFRNETTGKYEEGGFSTEDFYRLFHDNENPVLPETGCYAKRERKLKIALVAFATGNYIELAELFVSSAHKYFFPLDDVTVFLFTNKPEKAPKPQPGQKLVLKHMPFLKWPFSSMERFGALTNQSELFMTYDYVYQNDIDYLYQSYVCDEYLGDLVGGLHPGANCRMGDVSLPFDRNSASLAYVKNEETLFYYHGSQFGGRPGNVLHLAETCRRNIDLDAKNNQHARVDDESHLNRYFVDHPANKTFTKSYVFVDENYANGKMYNPCWWQVIIHRNKGNTNDWRQNPR